MMQNETQVPYSDEIDLLEFFQTIWDGKFKIAGAIVMAVLGVLGFFFTQPAPSFIAKTEVKPITSDLVNRYQISNSIGFFEVNAEKEIKLADEPELTVISDLTFKNFDNFFSNSLLKRPVVNQPSRAASTILIISS